MSKEATIEPYTKKCSAGIYNKVLKVDPKAKKTTTWDQAWVKLATEYNLDGSMESKLDSSRFILYKDDIAVHEFKWDNPMWNQKEGDFEWNSIYKEVLEYCTSCRLFTKNKKKAKDMSKKEVIDDSEEEPYKEEPKPITLDVLKKNLNRLSMRRSYYTKWKNPKKLAEIEKEILEVKNQIVELKTK